MNKTGRICLFIITLSLLTGCNPARLLGSFSADEHQNEFTNLMYGDQARHQLDLFLPNNLEQAKPLVVFVYGGGWRGGTRQNFRFIANALTRHGYGVAIPDYATYPQHRFPVFVDDVALAVSWLKQQDHFENTDTSRIVLVGHSAGAHITALLANDARYLSKVGLTPSAITAWIGIAGPYDFMPFTRDYMFDIFPVPLRRLSQPINVIDGTGPPALLLQGTADSVVDPRNSLRLHNKIKQLGGNSTLKLYDNIGHRKIIAAVSPLFTKSAPTLADILDFLEPVSTSGQPAQD